VAKVEGYFFLFIYRTTFPYSLYLLEVFNVITCTSIFIAPFRCGAGPRSCVLISVLALGGEGLGTAGLPESKLREFCREAGFSQVRRLPIEDPFNVIYEIKP
jgi:hypothetical protein